MSAIDDTATVVRRHVDAVRRWRMQDMIADYADDALMLVPGRAIRGKQAIAALFTQAQPNTNLRIVSKTYDGPIGLIVYSSDLLSFASDTFVILDGRIAFHTVAFVTVQEQ